MSMSMEDVGELFANRPAEAEEALLKMVEKNPKDVQAYLMLGVTRMKLGHYQEAAAVFRDALRIEADNRAAQVLLATALQSANDLPNALGAWQTVAKADPSSTDAQEHVALLAEATGQSDLALEALRQLVNLQPGRPEIVANLAVYLSRANKHAEALRMFERANTLEPGFVERHPAEESAYRASKASRGENIPDSEF